jgi:hypothetical protein
MSGRDLELDRVELDDAEAPWALPTGPTPIDTAERRLGVVQLDTVELEVAAAHCEASGSSCTGRSFTASSPPSFMRSQISSASASP